MLFLRENEADIPPYMILGNETLWQSICLAYAHSPSLWLWGAFAFRLSLSHGGGV